MKLHTYLFLLFFIINSNYCFAINKKNDLTQIASLVPIVKKQKLKINNKQFTLVEINAGDILQKRLKLLAEYIITEGLALGLSTEYRNENMYTLQQNNNTYSIGFHFSQYLQSLSLDGLFFRGETLLSRTKIQNNDFNNQECVFLSLNIDLAYRYQLSNLLTSSLGIGVRRNIPDFFTNKITKFSEFFEKHQKLWEIRLIFSMGLGL